MKSISILLIVISLISCNKQICPLSNGVVQENEVQDTFLMIQPNNITKISSLHPEVFAVFDGEIVSIINLNENLKTVLVKNKNSSHQNEFFIYSGLEKLNFQKGDFIKKRNILGELRIENGEYELGIQYRIDSEKLNPENRINCKK